MESGSGDVKPSQSYASLLLSITGLFIGTTLALHMGYIDLFHDTQNSKVKVSVSEDIYDEKLDFVANRELIYNSRRKQIAEACKSESKEMHRSLENILHFQAAASGSEDNVHLYTCVPFKTGMKSWREFGFQYSHRSTLERNHGEAVAAAKKKILLNSTQPDNVIRILNVRHPFDRLVSAYEDKFVKKYIDHLDQNDGSHITEEQRNDKALVYGIPFTHINAAIHSWVRAFWSHAKRMLAMEETSYDPVKRRHLVQFRTFIDYIASGAGLQFTGSGQEHWAPQFDYCQPCLVQYDIVTHTETIDQDMAYVRKRTHTKVKNVHNNGNQKARSGEERARVAQYFKDNGIDRNLLLRLHERYRLDFAAFGYDFNQFLTEYDGYTPNGIQ